MSKAADNVPVESPELSEASDFTVPVLSEELEVRKEHFRTGTVRLHKAVQQTPQMISEVLTSENVEIERVPMDVIIDVAPPVRNEGDVTVIPVVEEVLVITKQLRLKEELRITKRETVTNFYQEVPLRSEEITVERIDGKAANQP